MEIKSKDLLIRAVKLYEYLERKEITPEQGNAMAASLRQANNAIRFPHERANLEIKLHRHNVSFNSKIEINED